jgi:hypothetical protein
MIVHMWLLKGDPAIVLLRLIGFSMVVILLILAGFLFWP